MWMRFLSCFLWSMLAFAGGCVGGLGWGKPLLWYGHNPARNERFEIRAQEKTQWLTSTAGKRAGPFDEISVPDLSWGTGGRRFFVPARRNGRWHMIVDFEPSPAWSGVAAPLFSADEKHFAYGAESEGGWTVVRDGTRGRRWDRLIEGSLSFSPNGTRFGYAALAGRCAQAVVDENDSPCFRDVLSVVTTDNVANDLVVGVLTDIPVVVSMRGATPLRGLEKFFAHAASGHWVAILRNGGAVSLLSEDGPVDEAQEFRLLRFSSRGDLVYAAHRAQGWYAVMGARQEGPFKAIHALVSRDGGAEGGSIVRDQNDRTYVRMGEQTQGPWQNASGLVFSPNGQRCAYVADTGKLPTIVADNLRYPFDVVVETSISFSRDSAHWAALVGARSSRTLFITVDGTRRIPFDSEELFGAKTQEAGSPERLRRWVAAELELSLKRKAP